MREKKAARGGGAPAPPPEGRGPSGPPGPPSVHPGRIHILRDLPPGPGPIVYWMSRECRAEDNDGLLHARDLARAANAPLLAAYCLAPAFPGAGAAHFRFIVEGLRETAHTLDRLRIPFHLLRGDPAHELPALVARTNAGALVVDFDPLRPKRAWLAAILGRTAIRVAEVDSRNVVPCRAASDKREFAARTLRPKIHRLLPIFLQPPPPLAPMPPGVGSAPPPLDWSALLSSFGSLPPTRFRPGPAAARAGLAAFLRDRLAGYAERRNDPLAGATSDLSPWLHFGMLSARRVAVEAARAAAPDADKEAFLEELIVRRELADNFCHHTPDYDAYSALPAWARATLEKHRRDPRVPLYPADRFEAGETHDALWNAAQAEMVRSGKMHGYLRMYWAKKILEWSASPEEAIRIAVSLNDRYELDGRDPNGYAGVLWAIGGLHDRPWGERAVFGTVRYMGLPGMRKKFEVEKYIEKWTVDGREGDG